MSKVIQFDQAKNRAKARLRQKKANTDKATGAKPWSVPALPENTKIQSETPAHGFMGESAHAIKMYILHEDGKITHSYRSNGVEVFCVTFSVDTSLRQCVLMTEAIKAADAWTLEHFPHTPIYRTLQAMNVLPIFEWVVKRRKIAEPLSLYRFAQAPKLPLGELWALLCQADKLGKRHPAFCSLAKPLTVDHISYLWGVSKSTVRKYINASLRK